VLKFVRRHLVSSLVVLAFVLFVGGINLATIYTDWLWFGEVGQQAVLAKMLVTRLGLFVVFGGVAFALALVNLRLAERFAPSAPAGAPRGGRPNGGAGDAFLFDRDGKPQRVSVAGGGGAPGERMVNLLSGARRLVQALLGLGAAVFAVLAGLSAQGRWDAFLRFRNATPFGAKDALFGRDVGFYVFQLPFLQFAQNWLLFVLLIVGAAVAGLYVFQKGIDTATGRTFVAPHVRAHLSLLAALALLVQAWGYWLDRFELTTAGGKLFTGAGYTDVHVRLPFLNLLLGVTIVAALAVLVNLWRREIRLPLIAVGAWGAASLLGAFIPGTVQATKVRPNEANLEAPYIERALTATRTAYGLDTIRVEDFPADPGLSAADLRQNEATLRNVRLWDYEPLLETYPQQQGQRQYYAFPDVDVDRYRFPGATGYRQVWLAAREFDPDGLDARATTWPNLHLRYTHGYGVVMNPVNAVSAEGQPEFFLKDIPVASSVPGLELRQPRIYFGQAAPRGSYVVVKTRQPEFDYPNTGSAGASGGERSNVYDGRAGVPLGPLAKFAFAWRFRDPTLLLSGAVTRESRLLFARRIADRVQRVAPFLILDRDAYPVVTNAGRVVWIQDAYTRTPAYPYSATSEFNDARLGLQRVNYLRNAVKAVVDAYDGTVALYALDDNEPILRTYRRIFPGLVRPLSALDPDLRAHLRYPEDLLHLQRKILADYHVRTASDFYAKEDAWDIARELRDVESGLTASGNGVRGVSSSPDARATPVAVEPFYTIMRLPGEKTEEFLLLTPFTPRNKGVLSALLAARCDGDRLGELVLYRFPTTRTVYGPQQVGLRILQDERISQNLSLWNQQGSRVLFGNMLIVPVERSLMYVQPLYLKAQTGTDASASLQAGAASGSTSIPELKRVIVAFENRIAMEPTLEQALARLFGAGDPPAATAAAATGDEGGERPAATGATAAPAAPLIEQANAQYGRARAALRKGDFAAYGREIDALGQTLTRLRRAGPAPAGQGDAAMMPQGR